jgi:dipeptidyl aminopeptidase/acylaminoacyl peptidase
LGKTFWFATGCKVLDFSSADLRGTPLYKTIECFFADILVLGAGQISDAADLTVSADGRMAAFTGSVFASVTQAPATRIGILNLDDGDLQTSVAASGNDRLPKFSPDGRSLAFLSDRAEAGVYQLFLADAWGKNAVAMPPVAGVIESLSWSPDGSHLLLGVAGFGADMAGAQGGATTAKKGGGLPNWSPRIDTGDADNLWRVAYVFDVSSRSHRRVSPEGLNIWEASWLSDDAIIAVASNSHSEGSWYESRLVAIAVASGMHKDVYKPTYQLGLPVATADGSRMAVIEALCSDRLIVCGEVRVIDSRTGRVQALETGGVDVTQLIWRDSNTLDFVGHRGLETVLGQIDVAAKTASESWKSLEYTFGAWYPSFAILPQGGVLAVAESYSVAPEIVKIVDRRYERVRSLATPRSADPNFNQARIEAVSWKGRDGLMLEGWLVKPPGSGPFPLVMDVHGGPVWACRNRWQGRLRGAKVLADHGVASLYPNPRGSSGRGTKFAGLVRGDMGGADTGDYLSALDALVERGVADPDRLGVTGISYGGFISAWLITQDTRFAAAVPISPVINWYSQHGTSQIPYFDALFLDGKPNAAQGLYFERSPGMFADRVKCPVLQLTGALDQNTPPTQALEFHRSLLEHGVTSVLATYPTAGHGIRGFPEVIDATTRYVGWFLQHFAQRAGG